MSDLISRDTLIDHLNACLAESDGHTPLTDAVLTAVKCAVEQMPTVDAEPVRHGQWLKRECECYGSMECSEWLYCSVCEQDATGWVGDDSWYSHPAKTNYCPNCGAKMNEVSG